MTDWDPFYHWNSAYTAVMDWAGSESGPAQAAAELINYQSEEKDKDRKTLLIAAAGLGLVLLFKK